MHVLAVQPPNPRRDALQCPFGPLFEIFRTRKCCLAQLQHRVLRHGIQNVQDATGKELDKHCRGSTLAGEFVTPRQVQSEVQWRDDGHLTH